jgi:hypothetical protein
LNLTVGTDLQVMAAIMEEDVTANSGPRAAMTPEPRGGATGLAVHDAAPVPGLTQDCAFSHLRTMSYDFAATRTLTATGRPRPPCDPRPRRRPLIVVVPHSPRTAGTRIRMKNPRSTRTTGQSAQSVRLPDASRG